jgi:hypothetical protein
MSDIRTSPSGPRKTRTIRGFFKCGSDPLPIPGNGFGAGQFPFAGTKVGDTVQVTYNGILLDERPELIFSGWVKTPNTVNIAVQNYTVNPVPVPTNPLGFDVSVTVTPP